MFTFLNYLFTFFSGDSTKAFVEPRITEITMELLEIIRQTENDDLTTVCTLPHSTLKLEKSAISKVQKSIIRLFKNGKKSIFALEKSLKLPKMQF